MQTHWHKLLHYPKGLVCEDVSTELRWLLIGRLHVGVVLMSLCLQCVCFHWDARGRSECMCPTYGHRVKTSPLAVRYTFKVMRAECHLKLWVSTAQFCLSLIVFKRIKGCDADWIGSSGCLKSNTKTHVLSTKMFCYFEGIHNMIWSNS